MPTDMLSNLRFTVGSRAIFGCGAIEEIDKAIARLSQNIVFLVTDRGVASAGISGKIERILHTSGVAVATYDGVCANPTNEDVDAAAGKIRGFGPGAVVAVGGGSVLDVAKALALMAANEGSARDFDYRSRPARPGLPVVAVPTTAGTGSETNGFGVIEDLETGRKFYVGHESVVPAAVILDPELTCGLPLSQTAATGIDALAHALESLSSRRSNPYADGLALEAVRLVRRFLPRAVVDGQDIEARAHMLLAAHIAALAFATTGLGLAHAVAHAISARTGTAHGVALAVILPHVLAFNLPVRVEEYARAAFALGVDDSDKDDEAMARAAVDAVRRLSIDLEMPRTLRQLGCTDALIPSLVENALADEVIVNTPRLPRVDELQTLLRAAL